MMDLKRIFKITIAFSIYCLLINNSRAQGTSCADPTDLNPYIPTSGNGSYNLSVDNTSSSQFFTYTATQVGIIEMSSAYSNVVGDPTFDSWLKVYDTNCNLIFDQDNTVGLFGGVEFRTTVSVGDTYIFEWSNQEWAGMFSVEFIYHVPVTGQSCNDPESLVEGSNTVDTWFGDQYYTYTAANDGLLEVSTCGLWNSGGSNITLLDGCNGNEIGMSSDLCDEFIEGWESVTYSISEGETVIIKMNEALHKHYDYTFDVTFTVNGSNCSTPIEIPGAGTYSVANTNPSEADRGQWYKFTASKSGAAIITTGLPSLAKNPNLSYNEQTNIEVYNACGGTLVANNDNYPGFFGASLVNIDLIENTDYYILMIDELINAPYNFELFYEEDLIIGTEINPLDVQLGYTGDFGHLFHVPEQWFTYEFLESGTLDFQLTFIYSSVETQMTSPDNLQYYYFDEDDAFYGGFTYVGVAGESISFKLSGINTTFSTSLDSVLLSVYDESIQSISIYPNPTTDQLYISYLEAGSIEKIVLYDLTGRSFPIQWSEVSQNLLEINLNEISQGTYLISINDKKAQIVVKK